jgi:DNA-binding transcriptional ArsR family regulator
MRTSESDHGPTHDAVLYSIAVNPNCTAGDLSDSLMLTRRTIWGVIGDLRRAGIVHVRKIGRRHYYSANLDAPFRHPAMAGSTVGQVLAGLNG